MEQPAPDPGRKRSDSSPVLFIIILVLILAAILAFIIIPPRPAFATPNSNPGSAQPASQH
jgi:hypothetical protein